VEKQGKPRRFHRGDPLFFHLFPAVKSGGGDQGVGVDIQGSWWEYHFTEEEYLKKTSEVCLNFGSLMQLIGKAQSL
jgi:hypothetical protein